MQLSARYRQCAVILIIIALTVISGTICNGAYLDRELEDARQRALIKDFEGALEIYDYVLDEDPENIEALNGRAKVLAWMGRYDASRSSYREVLRLDPENMESITGISDTYAWEQDYEKAIRLMESKRAEHPQNKEILIRLARYHQKTGNRDEAHYYSQKILDTYPRDSEALEIRESISASYRNEAFLGYSYLNINNSSDGHNLYGGLRFNPGTFYTLFGRLDFLDRFNETEGKITGGGSYRLEEKLQLSGELGFAPDAEIFPVASGLVELASPALASWVFSGSLNYSHYRLAELFGFSISGDYYPYGHISILTRFTLSRIEFDGGEKSTDGAFLLKTKWFLGRSNNLYAYFIYGNEAFKPNTIDRVGDRNAKILGFGSTIFFTQDWGISPSFEYLDRNENTRYMQIGMEILRRW